jgi:hypothetical protein
LLEKACIHTACFAPGHEFSSGPPPHTTLFGWVGQSPDKLTPIKFHTHFGLETPLAIGTCPGASPCKTSPYPPAATNPLLHPETMLAINFIGRLLVLCAFFALQTGVLSHHPLSSLF